jgi:drug/metabolite transporter (DMT)-like permease
MEFKRILCLPQKICHRLKNLLGLLDYSLSSTNFLTQKPHCMATVVTTLSERRDHPLLGISAFVGNIILMALISALVKTLAQAYPLGEILLIRFIFASLSFWLILFSTAGFIALKTRRPIDHMIRSFSGIFSLGMFYYAVSVIPIADATALAYAAPIFITLFSIFLLDEIIGIRRWLAVITGFIGVLLIAQPGGAEWNAGFGAAIGSAVSGALVAIWLRRLSSSEKSVTIGVYYNSTGTLFCLALVAYGGWVLPVGNDLFLFLVFGLMCAAQQWLLTVSFRYAEASLLAPFEYLALVFAAIVGFVFWDEVPVLTTWLGAAVIAGSGLFIFMRKRQRAEGGEGISE